jgi:hypothetical protein
VFRRGREHLVGGSANSETSIDFMEEIAMALNAVDSLP